eukprot:TRINITY_DN47148_c0_g1_i1.p1 TRINITY_DN47148_c0_g1~~TRINITY_DN47148_c0_g1_i1.p1  ORF type:complete len:845 (+),score=295.45 TRINITY_DN47148_c0_g1_i1:122-2656(+)
MRQRDFLTVGYAQGDRDGAPGQESGTNSPSSRKSTGRKQPYPLRQAAAREPPQKSPARKPQASRSFEDKVSMCIQELSRSAHVVAVVTSLGDGKHIIDTEANTTFMEMVEREAERLCEAEEQVARKRGAEAAVASLREAEAKGLAVEEKAHAAEAKQLKVAMEYLRRETAEMTSSLLDKSGGDDAVQLEAAVEDSVHLIEEELREVRRCAMEETRCLAEVAKEEVERETAEAMEHCRAAEERSAQQQLSLSRQLAQLLRSVLTHGAKLAAEDRTVSSEMEDERRRLDGLQRKQQQMHQKALQRRRCFEEGEERSRQLEARLAAADASKRADEENSRRAVASRARQTAASADEVHRHAQESADERCLVAIRRCTQELVRAETEEKAQELEKARVKSQMASLERDAVKEAAELTAWLDTAERHEAQQMETLQRKAMLAEAETAASVRAEIDRLRQELAHAEAAKAAHDEADALRIEEAAAKQAVWRRLCARLRLEEAAVEESKAEVDTVESETAALEAACQREMQALKRVHEEEVRAGEERASQQRMEVWQSRRGDQKRRHVEVVGGLKTEQLLAQRCHKRLSQEWQVERLQAQLAEQKMDALTQQEARCHMAAMQRCEEQIQTAVGKRTLVHGLLRGAEAELFKLAELAAARSGESSELQEEHEELEARQRQATETSYKVIHFGEELLEQEEALELQHAALESEAAGLSSEIDAAAAMSECAMAQVAQESKELEELRVALSREQQRRERQSTQLLQRQMAMHVEAARDDEPAGAEVAVIAVPADRRSSEPAAVLHVRDGCRSSSEKHPAENRLASLRRLSSSSSSLVWTKASGGGSRCGWLAEQR